MLARRVVTQRGLSCVPDPSCQNVSVCVKTGAWLPSAELYGNCGWLSWGLTQLVAGTARATDVNETTEAPSGLVGPHDALARLNGMSAHAIRFNAVRFECSTNTASHCSPLRPREGHAARSTGRPLPGASGIPGWDCRLTTRWKFWRTHQQDRAPCSVTLSFPSVPPHSPPADRRLSFSMTYTSLALLSLVHACTLAYPNLVPLSSPDTA